MRSIDDMGRIYSRASGVLLAALTVVAAGIPTAGLSMGPSGTSSQGGPFAEDLPITASSLPDKMFLGDFEPGPANDTCETAPGLLLSTQVNGTTHNAAPNYDSGLETCTGYAQAGPDVAYSMVLLSSQSYTVTLTPEASFDASVALLGPGAASVCNAIPVTCLTGADSQAYGGAEVLHFTPSQTGTYYIIVDSYYSGSGGTFAIEVTSP